MGRLTLVPVPEVHVQTGFYMFQRFHTVQSICTPVWSKVPSAVEFRPDRVDLTGLRLGLVTVVKGSVVGILILNLNPCTFRY